MIPSPSHNKTKNKDDQVVAPCIPQYHGGDKRRSSNWQLTLIFDYIFKEIKLILIKLSLLFSVIIISQVLFTIVFLVAFH